MCRGTYPLTPPLPFTPGQEATGVVTAVGGDDARATFCRELGADATINHRAGPVATALREVTDGHGVDLIYDPVGGALAEEAAGAMARGGRLLAVGFASGEWPSLAT